MGIGYTSDFEFIEEVNERTGYKYRVLCHKFYGILSYFEELKYSGIIYGSQSSEQTFHVLWYQGKKTDFGVKFSATGTSIVEALKNLESCQEIQSIWSSPL